MASEVYAHTRNGFDTLCSWGFFYNILIPTTNNFNITKDEIQVGECNFKVGEKYSQVGLNPSGGGLFTECRLSMPYKLVFVGTHNEYLLFELFDGKKIVPTPLPTNPLYKKGYYSFINLKTELVITKPNMSIKVIRCEHK